MKTTTLKILEATLQADGTVTAPERNKILKLARGEDLSSAVQNGNGHEPIIYSRAKAAQMLGNKSVRFVDLLSRRGELIKKVPKGNKRAIGICGYSLRAFIEGTAGKANELN